MKQLLIASCLLFLACSPKEHYTDEEYKAMVEWHAWIEDYEWQSKE